MMEVPGRNRTGHGGNIHAVLRDSGKQYGQILDFSANINPIGPPPWLRSHISRELDQVLHYPDPEYAELCQAIGTFMRVDSSLVVPANGSTELLYLLPRVVDCNRAVVPVPSYIDYVKAARQGGMDILTVPLTEENDFQLDPVALGKKLRKGDMVILGSPNNPTGSLVAPEVIQKLADNFPSVLFVIDEAFLDFMEGQNSVAGTRENIITLNSMTKFFGVPGLRLGFGIFPERIAEKLRLAMPPWTINSFAQSFGTACLQDQEYKKRTISTVKELRCSLSDKISQIPGLKLYPATVNYLFLRLTNGVSAPQLATLMMQHNILIRCCDNYEGLDDTYFRVAVRTEEENVALIGALQASLGPKQQHGAPLNRKTPALMFQGTSSNAGKSVLNAALCRILLQDGVRVAPFKAQNMSLNSYVTLHGEEMGRAQVVQAQAAKLDPDVRMNPVLLKPNSDTGSQIIVKGKPVGNMSVLDYDRYKPQAWEAVKECYDSLASEYDTIILEGAGSPGEVNLKRTDIVNMKMAAYAKSPVLLVGDIDRGGVYASFIGTMEVLDQWERDLVAGFVVNRFRGQQSLLASAHEYIANHTGKVALGVVPYLQNLGLPEEDSVSFKAGSFTRTSNSDQPIHICLVNFPHISNFTDVEPFLDEPDVSLTIANRPEELEGQDVIILPGSKNVIGDLHFLEKNDFVNAIRKKAEQGCEVVGICGGYQILGRTIADPHGIESTNLDIEAIGLLDIATEMMPEKRLVRQKGIHLPSGHDVFGYEIHHGISETMTAEPILRFESGSTCGSTAGNGLVWGSYLHGIFDSDDFRRWFLDSVHERKGHERVGRILAPYNVEAALDRLADTVRESIDMDRIYAILGV